MQWACRQQKKRHISKIFTTGVVTLALAIGVLGQFATGTAGAAPLTGAFGAQTITSASTTFADDTSTADMDPCNASGDPLTWVVCPVVGMLHEATNTMQSVINHLMTIDVNSTFDTSTASGKAYYSAWNSFRVFGIALIVIAGLVMVISQALGMEIFDAYTIKKVLPRLFIAAIGISLSWWIMKFAVEMTNDIGIGIRTIVLYPFQGMAGNAGLQNWASSLLDDLALVGAYAFLQIGGVLSLFATAGLAALIAFLVLVIRQIVIIFAILIAPLAIACFVLPNTQKAYHMWWETFSKALLMFPIISLFIAAGQAFSIVASSDSSSSYSINKVVALVAYFIPYFALPFTFRLAGGAIATLGGIVNDRSRGGFDRLKKYRGRKIEESSAQMKAGTRFNNRALNTLTARATTSRLGFGERGKAAYEQKMALASHEFGRTGQGQAIQFNDPALQAMTYGSAMEARANMARDWGVSQSEVESAIAGVKANGGFGKARQIWATKQLAATGTGYDDTAQMYSAISRVAGSNSELAGSMWGEMRGASERAGRVDLKAGYGSGVQALQQIQSSGLARTDQIRDTFSDTFTNLDIEAARGMDNMQLMRQKPKTIRNVMRSLEKGQQQYQRIAQDPTSTPVQREQAEAMLGQIRAKMENMQDSKQYAPEINMEHIHGARSVVVTERDATGRPTQATTARDAGVERSLPFVARAQEQAAGRVLRPDELPAAQTAYREERTRPMSPEQARLLGLDENAPPPPGGDQE